MNTKHIVLSSGPKSSTSRTSHSKTAKAGLVFPVARIFKYLKAGRYTPRVSGGASCYLAAVLEYLTAEVLEISGSCAKDEKNKIIKPSHIHSAVRDDEELQKLFGTCIIPSSGKVMITTKKSSPPQRNQQVQRQTQLPSAVNPPITAFFGTQLPQTCAQCTTPTADGFKCPTLPPANHHTCHHCQRPFPARQPATVPDTCECCQQHFCGLYWQCPARGVKFLRLRDYQVDSFPNDALLQNPFETKRLMEYIDTCLHSTAQAVWDSIIDKLSSDPEWQKLTMGPHQTPITSEMAVCSTCFARAQRELLLNYRESIPKTAMPAAVQQLDDCWYGTKCRTQWHKWTHAQKYNHICPQTKF
ncbi:putative Histone H2A [Blattamonas nauphoetae]|uniref:Histone H2A n=1 Tax=Blattamonas nauphoetae TaxID=2049346 RepID=A0ABQ9Y6Z5_9EUKA|nr:putative Histone H2A [Blattamonas nauphoetae]